MNVAEVITKQPVAFTRPLVGVWTVLSVTSLDSEDAVLSAVEAGRLRWAWNIASRHSSKMTLRILAKSVCDFMEGADEPGSAEDEDFSQVKGLIFPFEVKAISAGAIARAWNCASWHISHLCKEGSLRAAEHSPRRKPGAQLIVDYASAVNFLAQRRVY